MFWRFQPSARHRQRVARLIFDEREPYLNVKKITLKGSVVRYYAFEDNGECTYSAQRARFALRTGKRKISLNVSEKYNPHDCG